VATEVLRAVVSPLEGLPAGEATSVSHPLEVADVFRAHGPAWERAQHSHLNQGQIKVMSTITQCRSEALGGHVLHCPACDHAQIAYNSCRDLHCPKCQASVGSHWLNTFSGGKPILLGISKRGDAYLRTLLIHGARSVIRIAERKAEDAQNWRIQLIGRRHKNIAMVALANKSARIVWALLAQGRDYQSNYMPLAA
jgi:hypothetical protein